MRANFLTAPGDIDDTEGLVAAGVVVTVEDRFVLFVQKKNSFLINSVSSRRALPRSFNFYKYRLEVVCALLLRQFCRRREITPYNDPDCDMKWRLGESNLKKGRGERWQLAPPENL